MPRPLATLTLLITTIIWGFAFTAQKTGMATMGPLTFAAARYLLAGLVILPLALREFRRRNATLGRREFWLLAGLSLAFFMGSWLQNAGVTLTTVTKAGFLTALYVLFTPLIALFVLRRRPHPVVWVCVPLALAGTWCLNGGGFDGFNFGDLLVVGCAVFWAIHIMILGELVEGTGLPIFVSTVSFLAAGCLSLVLSPFEHPTLAGIFDGWGQIAYGGILATAIAFTLQAVGQRYVPAANAAIILSAESLFAALGASLLLGERLTPVGYAGAAAILVAIVLVETVPVLTRRAGETPAPGEQRLTVSDGT